MSWDYLDANRSEGALQTVEQADLGFILSIASKTGSYTKTRWWRTPFRHSDITRQDSTAGSKEASGTENGSIVSSHSYGYRPKRVHMMQFDNQTQEH